MPHVPIVQAPPMLPITISPLLSICVHSGTRSTAPTYKHTFPLSIPPKSISYSFPFSHNPIPHHFPTIPSAQNTSLQIPSNFCEEKYALFLFSHIKFIVCEIIETDCPILKSTYCGKRAIVEIPPFSQLVHLNAIKPNPLNTFGTTGKDFSNIPKCISHMKIKRVQAV